MKFMLNYQSKKIKIGYTKNENKIRKNTLYKP